MQQASLLLHVSDITDPNHSEHDAEVEKVLSDLGVDARPRLRVFNKIDRLDADSVAALVHGNGNVYVSALLGTGLDELLRRVDEVMPVDPVVRLSFTVPLSDGRTLALVHGLGRVLRSEVRGTDMQIDADLPESLAHRLRLEMPPEAHPLPIPHGDEPRDGEVRDHELPHDEPLRINSPRARQKNS